ncbi:MAG: hypothetical protein KDJ65_23645, partial [Anaerolineae bacterium]|nr:hypothetical protein [Anaerolineae bacterium]
PLFSGKLEESRGGQPDQDEGFAFHNSLTRKNEIYPIVYCVILVYQKRRRCAANGWLKTPTQGLMRPLRHARRKID